MIKNIPKLFFTTAITLFFSTLSQANENNEVIQNIEKKYLACEIMWKNTNDINRFKLCSNLVNSLYVDEIKRVRSSSNYKEKSKWNLINAEVNNHYDFCVELATKTNLNKTLHSELESCLQTRNQLLLIEALSL